MSSLLLVFLFVAGILALSYLFDFVMIMSIALFAYWAEQKEIVRYNKNQTRDG